MAKRIYIERARRNKYQTRGQLLKLGLAHFKDALVIFLTLGQYRSAYTAYASEDILRNAVNIKRGEPWGKGIL